MRLKFRIEYHTQWGQELFLLGSIGELGAWDHSNAMAMTHAGNGIWLADIDIKKKHLKDLSYKYLVREGDSEIREWGEPRRLTIHPGKFKSAEIRDFWRTRHDSEHVFYASAFTDNLFARSRKKKSPFGMVDGYEHVFRLEAPRIHSRYHFCLLGSDKSMGKWDPSKAVILNDVEYPVWQVHLKIGKKRKKLEYKYGIYDTDTKQLIAWEAGANRVLDHNHKKEKDKLYIQNDIHFEFGADRWKGAGVAIPVFSLRSRKSYGVGEFKDLKLLIDWAVKTGMKLIQILPVNDTIATHSWKDSYPYAAISVFGLHPIYLHPPSMGKIDDQTVMKRFETEAEKLNQKEEIDYEAVMDLKSKYFKIIYDQQRDAFLKDSSFKKFFDKNKHWLVPYAAFSCLRDRFKTSDFSRWKEFSVYDQARIEKLVDPKNEDFDDFAVHYYIQYHLDKQLSQVAAYAKKKCVILKGDIPIGIFRHSMDAWMYPHLFNMDKQAGAPPDDFSANGQNWGFPTYNWEEMAKDDYRWWKSRLSVMANYFDAYRIDHILGFFRIWEIPMEHLEGLMGYFNPALPMQEYEIQGNGLSFDVERFCKPWIREYMLDELFGATKEAVKQAYLTPVGDDRYEIRQEYQSQRAVAASLKIGNTDTEEERREKELVKNGMFALIRNFLFIEVRESGGEGFHPRIALQFTHSFKELSDHEQHVLNRIYNHYFYERQEHFWREKAMVKLPAIMSATKMMVCGEDLGMVPDCVEGVMDELGILNLEIQRMPKNQHQLFSNPKNAGYLSVSSTSSHDMSTIRGWWEEDRHKTQLFFNHELGMHGEAPAHCEPWICGEIIQQQVGSPAMWVILPIQDYLAMDENLRREDVHSERINVPSNSQHYWKYRFHIFLEDLLKEDSFNGRLKDVLKEAGRNGE